MKREKSSTPSPPALPLSVSFSLGCNNQGGITSILIVHIEVDTDFVESEGYTILGFSSFKKKNIMNTTTVRTLSGPRVSKGPQRQSVISITPREYIHEENEPS